MSGGEPPFECWAVIRPGQRGLSKAAAEAAAGEGDRVVHLVESRGRPMSEAPKDGTKILVVHPIFGTRLVEWQERSRAWTDGYRLQRDIENPRSRGIPEPDGGMPYVWFPIWRQT